MGFGVFSTLFLWVLTQRFPTILGWNYYEILFISSFNMFCYSFSLLFFIQIQEIDYYVRNGEFDRILVRPMNSLFQFATIRFNINSLGTVLYSLIVLFYSGYHAKDWGIMSITQAIVLIVCGVIVSFSIHLFIGATSFLTMQSGGFFQLKEVIYENVCNYPINIFSQGIQLFLTFILPIGFIGFYPSAGLLNKSSTLLGDLVLPICILFSLVLFIVSYVFWNFAIKSYSGSGS
ncbi:ABC transporter permease [Priestia koreensis]|uniref:ABC transporter permease n=1 Tax=Priestia koreensis TaxID=284581 RepID=UPI003D01DD2B